ncbi:SMI1/KNR4 family protein [Dickeya zeae]|uniref:SMI1/KNR4 family protein n=1 Tax=Dickeya zeae TaxID=204042 RepID=UPI001C637A12|nr:SMI1/KNR4 family protein [Dickeya zeae]
MLPLVEKLLSICSDSISPVSVDRGVLAAYASPLACELITLLKYRNGFYCFESALHVFSFNMVGDDFGIVEWNNNELWIDAYDDMARNALYFAEDIFGGQFCIKNDGIYTFDPETGMFSWLANSINEWCGIVLNEYKFITGYPLAHSWQKMHGLIPSGYRLVPKVPFVAGGDFDINNIYVEKSDKAMRSRANIALQIRDIPDGGHIQLDIIT